MRRVQQKISQGLEVLTFFTMRQWLFDSTKFQKVNSELDKEDQEMQVDLKNILFLQFTNNYNFYRFYMNTKSIENENELDYLRITLLGGRQYCLKEPLSTLPKARIQLKL